MDAAGQENSQNRQENDPLSSGKEPAIHCAAHHQQSQYTQSRRGHGQRPRAVIMCAHHPGKARLARNQDSRQGNKERHDEGKRAGRYAQQQAGTNERPASGAQRQATDAAARQSKC